jgi:hypothetical protein
MEEMERKEDECKKKRLRKIMKIIDEVERG